MNLQQRLTKLEEQTSEGRPVVVWMNPGETQEDARKKTNYNDFREILYVAWENSEPAAL
jgi:uncharacterized protein YheU (UPF0270 family)